MEEIWKTMQTTWDKLPQWAKWAIPIAIAILVLLLIRNRSKAIHVDEWTDRTNAVLGPLNGGQRHGVGAIVHAFQTHGDGDHRKLAYILATARHESRFLPIREYRAKPSQAHIYALQNRYWHTGYMGRGFVQLTWERNYAKMSPIVGIDLVSQPDRALEMPVAAKILVVGMMQGMFTRRRLDEFINDHQADYYAARKTVNGLDRADRIAAYAEALLNGA